jgi:hypothetical protein
MIPRILTLRIFDLLFKGKAIIITGPRQAGKTTLVKMVLEKAAEPYRWFNGDESDVRTNFANPTSTGLKALIGNAKIVVIDEAQRIENIGLCMKLLVDNYSSLQVIATGSSSFDLANKINEPLTGRKWEYNLFPLSFEELSGSGDEISERRMLNHRLLYGSYPEVVTSPGREERTLRQLADSYLYKDILTWERIHKPDRLERLVKALALQIGSQVSFNEVGMIANLDGNTVEKYITLLEKAYIVFRLPAFSRNVRNELKKTRKIYFYDTGIRNAVIGNFSSMSTRTDIGGLWENYLIAERFKWVHYHDRFAGRYFWRTTQQQEIDYIEDYSGVLHAYEFKWNPNKTARVPKTFSQAYPTSGNMMISPGNYGQFLTGNDGLTEQPGGIDAGI